MTRIPENMNEANPNTEPAAEDVAKDVEGKERRWNVIYASVVIYTAVLIIALWAFSRAWEQ